MFYMIRYLISLRRTGMFYMLRYFIIMIVIYMICYFNIMALNRDVLNESLFQYHGVEQRCFT